MSNQQQPAPAFVLVSNPTVQWPVTVQVPTNGGTFAPHRFTGTFRVMAESDYLALFPQRSEADAAKREFADVLAENAEALPRVLVGWDVKGPDGAPVGIEHLAAALRGEHGAFLGAGIRRAVTEIRFGLPAQPPATLGNSPTAPDIGSGAQQDDPAPTSSPTI
ncbi:hypothetical protein ACNQFN_11525 [Thauera butanivorans]|uniref:hypothetical protein n=1 Tax=Thauera butanivorans TaxID=86174 RepID=UPI003AB3E68C